MRKSTTTFTSKTTGTECPVGQSFNCKSSSVTYMIKRKCDIQYIGQTSTTKSTRMAGHRFDIKNKVNKSVPNHFNMMSHSLHDITLMVIDNAPSDVTS